MRFHTKFLVFLQIVVEPKDILKNNKAGLIYPINDKQKLINSILKILKNYNHFHKAAIVFSKTQNRFSINKQSEKYLKFLIS